MIALFRPPPSAPPNAPMRSRPATLLSESSAQPAKALASLSSADTAGGGPDSSAGSAPHPISGGETARGQADLDLLKAEVEHHLKAQKAVEDQKIAHLARLCARMEPGRAAVTLSPLDDATIHRILLQLDKDSALKIQSVLVRIRKESG